MGVEVKKIIVSFGCGLGNQMFQYAFYCALQQYYTEYEILADTKVMLPQQHNGYELEYVFGLNIPRCRFRDYSGYWRHVYIHSGWMFPLNALFYIIRKYFPNPTFYKQANYTFYYPEIFRERTADKYCFKGIWANEKYFGQCKERLLKEFIFIQNPGEETYDYVHKIKSSYSVGVHVRRGDYVRGNYNLLDESYYRKAFSVMENLVTNPTYFVFSDDLIMADALMRNTTKKSYVLVRGNTGINSWKDMYLMSMCQHNIIANSSFSFWGAYLNQNQHKIVISPQKGMSDQLLPFTCDDWILIE